MKRHPSLLCSDRTFLVLIDYQERLAPAMASADEVTSRVSILLKGARILGIPVLVTEQYPKGLGQTLPSITNEIPDARIIPKTTFSCCGEESFRAVLRETSRNQVVLAGIESHVCVLQTALDLLARDYQVHVPFDTTSSRNPAHKENALARMREAGAVITQVESVLFEWLADAKKTEFKEIQALII